jgi:hypothetical protein
MRRSLQTGSRQSLLEAGVDHQLLCPDYRSSGATHSASYEDSAAILRPITRPRNFATNNAPARDRKPENSDEYSLRHSPHNFEKILDDEIGMGGSAADAAGTANDRRQGRSGV